jgi:hypothetical protein
MSDFRSSGRRWSIVLFAISLIGVLTPEPARSQELGSFRWQLQPYCNIVTLTVTQQGGQYTLDGTDDQCAAVRGASVRGMAYINASGSIGFGLTIVTTPGGTPVHVDATISRSSLNGVWNDSLGNSGNFVFTPGPGVPGSGPRPRSFVGVRPSSITSEHLAPGSVDTTQIAPEAVTGAKVAADALTTVHIADAPRAAFTTASDTVSLPGSVLQTIRTASLIIPAPGQVIANASGYFALRSAAQDHVRCGLGNHFGIDADYEIRADDFGVTASQSFVPVSLTRGFSVSPGTFTVRLVCEELSGNVEIRNATLTLLFIASRVPAP